MSLLIIQASLAVFMGVILGVAIAFGYIVISGLHSARRQSQDNRELTDFLRAASKHGELTVTKLNNDKAIRPPKRDRVKDPNKS